MRAVLRRSTPDSVPQQRRFGPLDIDLARHEVRPEGRLIPFNATEFRLLDTLSAEPGRVFTRSQLLGHVWGEVFEGYGHTIDSHIKNLRHKVQPLPDSPRFVSTLYTGRPIIPI